MKKFIIVLMVAFVGAICSTWVANAADSPPSPTVQSSATAGVKSKATHPAKKHKKHKKKKSGKGSKA